MSDQSNLERPREPRLEDFGITDAVYREFNKLLSDQSGFKESREATTGCLSVSLGYILAPGACAVGIRETQGSLGMKYLAGFGLFFLVVAVIFLLKKGFDAGKPTSINRKLDSYSVETKSGCAQYEKAVSLHKIAMQEYARACHDLDQKRRSYWTDMDGHEFEHRFAERLRGLGYSASVTPGSGDGGIDVVAHRNGKTIVIQCKAWSAPVPPAPVRELQGVREPGQDAWLVGLGGFTKGAIEFAESRDIRLIDVDDLLGLS